MSPGTVVTPDTGERCTRHTTSKARSRRSRACPTTPDAPVSRMVRRTVPDALPMLCGPAMTKVSSMAGMVSPDSGGLLYPSRAHQALFDTNRAAYHAASFALLEPEDDAP